MICLSQISNSSVTNRFVALIFFKVRIGFFSNTVRPRAMKFGLNLHCFIYFIKLF